MLERCVIRWCYGGQIEELPFVLKKTFLTNFFVEFGAKRLQKMGKTPIILVERMGVPRRSNLGNKPTLPVSLRMDKIELIRMFSAKNNEAFSVNAKVVAPQKRVPACSGSGITCGTFEMLSSLKFKLCVEESIVHLQVSMCHLQESVVNLCQEKGCAKN